jgi:vacuolar-type H+-ATPase subunit E/Vma4
MALEDILRALESEANSRCAEIRASAMEEAEQEENRVRLRCRDIVRERLGAHEGVVAQRAHRIVNTAKMKSRHDVAAERDRLIEEVFREAQSSLASLREDRRYRERFAALLHEAFEDVESPTGVSVDPQDLELATTVLSTMGATPPVAGDIATAGGAVVFSHGGRVRHDNTLETRMSRVEERTRERVSELLFG